MSTPFVSSWAFTVDEGTQWLVDARGALETVSQQIGFQRASVLHSPEEPSRYVVICTWQDVGSYRRALSSTDMKLNVWPFLAAMHDEPSVYETLLETDSHGMRLYDTSLAAE